MMNTFISGERQYNFVSKFNYVREAGTCGEQRAAETILQELKKENSDAQILDGGCFLFLHRRLSALSLR